MRIRYTNIVARCSDTPQRRIFDLRAAGLPEIPMLGWYGYRRARPDLPLHRHRGCLEIHFRERGEQPFQIAQREYPLHGGDLLVTLPNEPHSTGGHPSAPGVMYGLLVKLPTPGHGLLGLSLEESRLLLDRFQELPIRQFRARPEVKRWFDTLFELYDDRETFLRQARLRMTAIQLLMGVLDSAVGHAQSQTSVLMGQVVHTIHAHPEGVYRLEDLARQTHLSLARFKGRFKAELGISPRQFILHAKIEAAQQRLREGSRPITEIALDLGFVSSQYFATVFKRITGMTPRAYRHGPGPRGPSRRRDDGQG